MHWQDLRNYLQQPAWKTTLGKLMAALGVFAVLVGTFAYIAEQVTDGDTQAADTGVLLGLNSLANPLLDAVALAVTYSGNVLSVGSVSAIVVAIFVSMQKWRPALQVACTMGGALILGSVLKLIFQRERPELWQLLTHEATYSFPSGHALLTAAFATLLILLFRRSQYRWLVFTVAALYPLLVGLSRLYLGVHYPTDVLAGWCVGAAWAIVVALLMKQAPASH